VNDFLNICFSASLAIIATNRFIRAISSDIPAGWDEPKYSELWRIINFVACAFYAFLAVSFFPHP
jgi:hypothetical protein